MALCNLWISGGATGSVLFALFTGHLMLMVHNTHRCRATEIGQSVDKIKHTIETSTTSKSTDKMPSSRLDQIDEVATRALADHTNQAQNDVEKRVFVTELLKMLHEEYGTKQEKTNEDQMQSRQGQLGFAPEMMHSLLNAIGADGDMRRLIEWIRNTFNVASIPDLTTQFVVSKLASVNCPAMLRPDKEETLVPRFLLFNENFVEVPFELSINPTASECISHGKFDPRRRTIILVHGYLTGYTLVDGMTNIKDRLLDLNQIALKEATKTFAQTAEYHFHNGSSYVYTEDLNHKIRSQLYNIILVDWFNGANPTPRANYIKAAVNAQVVGKLIARFLSALVAQCGTPAANLQIIAHSLGCHVSGFTGKAMNAAGHRLGKITHLDPVGLCFGRLFSQPRFRLSPNDALETQAVHVSLNIFDNPLDGAHSNFLVNGGRDQVGCGGQSEVKNSTTSSVSLLFDPAARFGPCSHVRALALFEDDHSSKPGKCQLVGYRCQNYDKFLAGKCGHCDATNTQCSLMSLPPISMHFRKMTLDSSSISATHADQMSNFYYEDTGYTDLRSSASLSRNGTVARLVEMADANSTLRQQSTKAPSLKMGPPTPTGEPATTTTKMYGAPAYIIGAMIDNELGVNRRSDRGLLPDKRERLSQVMEKLRTETRTVLTSGWTNLRAGSQHATTPQTEELENEHETEMTTSETTTKTTTVSSTNELSTSQETTVSSGSSSRLHEDFLDQLPLGSQKLPSGSLNMPQYYLGTGSLSPFCVNYYQFRVLISDSRLQKILKSNGLGSNKMLPQLSQHRGGFITAASTMQQRVVRADGRDMLHLTVRLVDNWGRFFKGFSMLENARELTRVMSDFSTAPLMEGASMPFGPAIRPNEPMVELTMLLNSTEPEPRRIDETVISYYFHQVVLADRVEINYMSNISPE